MRCPIARTLFTEYLENTLNPTTKRELEEHLASCVDCQNLLQERRTAMGLSSDAIDKATACAVLPVADISGDVQAEALPRSKGRSSRSSGSSRKGKEKFAPRSSQRTDEVRKTLETAGVLVPDSSRASAEVSASREDVAVPSAGEGAQATADPMQQLMQRYAQPVSESPAASANRNSARNNRRQRQKANAVTPEREQATRAGYGVDQTASGVQPAPSNEEQPAVSPIGNPTVVDPRDRIFLITPDDEDKSDDAVWVDIFVIHHVTRQQVAKRVRRDSSDAQRYFAAFGIDPMSMQPLEVEKPVAPSYGQDQLRPRPDLDSPIEPVVPVIEAPSASTTDQSPQMAADEDLEQEDEGDELFSTLLGYSLPDQHPDDARVVVVSNYVSPEVHISIPPSVKTDMPLVTPDFTAAGQAGNADAEDAVSDDLEAPALILPLFEEDEPSRGAETVHRPDSSRSEATSVLDQQTSAVSSTEENAGGRVQPSIAPTDITPDSFRIFLPVDDDDDEEETLQHAVNDDAEDDDAYQFVLPEAYNSAARSHPRPPTPAQTNPIVSRPAEIGRERLANQSRYGRTEANIIGRDHSAPSPSSMSFGRMRWFEGLKRNPYGLVMLIGALILILFLVIGALVSQMNAPWAKAKVKLDSDMSAWESVLRVAAETNTATGLTLPEPFALSTEGEDTPMRAQLMEINALYSTLSDTLQCWENDAANDILFEQRATILAGIQPSLVKIAEQLRALQFPQSEEDWLYTMELIEPVETLARRYLTYGTSSNYNLPSGTLSKEQLQAVVSPVPLNIAYADRVFSLRTALDEWHLRTRVVGGTGEYTVVVDDVHQTIVAMQAIGEPSLYVGFDVLAMEQWLSQLMRSPYYYLGESQVDKAVDYRSVWFVPMRNLRLWISEPLQLVFNDQGFIVQFKVYSLEHGEEHSLEPGTMDLFQAASVARSDLFLPPMDGEEIYLVESGSSLAAYPSLMWYYRCFTEMGWQIRFVSADGAQDASSLIDHMVHYFNAMDDQQT